MPPKKSYSAALQAYMKLESLVFSAPELAPTSLVSITRGSLDKMALQFHQRFNEKTVVSFLNDLLAPVTPPPSSFCIQPIAAAYNNLEAFVINLFFAPPPPPPRTFQSIAKGALKTFSLGYEQAYERLESYSTQLRSFQWNKSLFLLKKLGQDWVIEESLPNHTLLLRTNGSIHTKQLVDTVSR